MSTSNGNTLEIPTALPGLEDENGREQLLQSANGPSETIDSEDKIDDELDIQEPPKKSTCKRALKAVAGLLIFFILLFATVSWFFGIGMFSEEKAQPINRSARSETQAPATEDEKLKMALSMVAAKEPSSNSEPNSPSSKAAAVTVPPQFNDARTDGLSSSADPKTNVLNVDKLGGTEIVTSGERFFSQTKDVSERSQPQINAENEKGVVTNKASAKTGELSSGRSVFFGKERRNGARETNRNEAINREEGNRKEGSKTPHIPFGTLLPVRLTSATYTFRNSGGFIRMELTRGVEGKGYSYPAGTTVVGTLRGSEASRVFVTVTGLIDPESGQLVKLGGELLGRDGASGIQGRKRRVTGVWSRLLRGLRETGLSVISSIGGWRSGGTVIIADAMRRAGSDIPGSLSSSGSSQSDSFVLVDAGSMGFVQVTGLPEGVSKTGGVRAGTESGLTDEELADLFSGSSSDKLRAALPKMTPEFRRLAEEALKNLESK